MRTVIRCTLAVLLVATPAWAQEDLEKLAKVPPRVRATIQTDFMAKKLQLSPQEKTQVDAINLKYADQMQPVLAGSMGPLARMGEVKRLEEAKDGELRGVLNPSQFQAYTAAKAEMRQHLEQKATEKMGGTP